MNICVLYMTYTICISYDLSWRNVIPLQKSDIETETIWSDFEFLFVYRIIHFPIQFSVNGISLILINVFY